MNDQRRRYAINRNPRDDEDKPRMSDVALAREALKEQSPHWDLHVVADGEKVIEFIDRLDADSNLRCPVLVLLDMHLPKRDGEAILKHLRASDRCGPMPVGILSSIDYPRDKGRVGPHPAIHYFRKPSSFLQFMELGVIVRKAIVRATAH